MKKLNYATLVIATSVFFTGCTAVKTGNEKLGELDKKSVEQIIVKDYTTKADIKSIFGDPDTTDFDNNSLEKWTYLHVRKASKGINYVPIVNMFVSGTNDTTKSLVIVFNDNGTVKNYINSDAKGETKGGLFQ